jgi:predicted restriction endonuclease
LEFHGHGGYTLLSSALIPKASDISSEYLIPNRAATTIHRIIRDTEIVAKLKRLYLYQCQICATRLELSSGYYCEAHHLKPLGTPHDGPDSKSNIIIVCPNHHVLLDYGALKIDTKSLELDEHLLDPELLDYHNGTICGKP